MQIPQKEGWFYKYKIQLYLTSVSTCICDENQGATKLNAKFWLVNIGCIHTDLYKTGGFRPPTSSRYSRSKIRIAAYCKFHLKIRMPCGHNTLNASENPARKSLRHVYLLRRPNFLPIQAFSPTHSRCGGLNTTTGKLLSATGAHVSLQPHQGW